jgi:hypothetical protein
MTSFWRRPAAARLARTAECSRTKSPVLSLPDAAGRHAALLAAVAPHVGETHGTYEFLEQLNRLVEKSPKEISEVVGVVVQTGAPIYDYEGRLNSLLSRLADLGHRKEALEYCEQLREVKGIPELFAKLRNAAG